MCGVPTPTRGSVPSRIRKAASWCQHSRVGARRARWIATSVVAIEAVVLLAGLVSDRLLVRAGHADLVRFRGETWVLLLGVASAAAGRVRDRPHPAAAPGRLALPGAERHDPGLRPSRGLDRVGSTGTARVAAREQALSRRSTTPRGSRGSSSSRLILLLTPTGTYLSPRWRALGRVIVGAGAVAFLLSLAEDGPVRIAVPGHREPVGRAGDPAGVRLGRIRPGAARGRRPDRFRCVAPAALATRQRRRPSPAAVASPRRGARCPLFVVAAFVASSVGSSVGTVAATGGFVVLIPIAAGLSITRYHLYDVERILARTTTYVASYLAADRDLRTDRVVRRARGPALVDLSGDRRHGGCPRRRGHRGAGSDVSSRTSSTDASTDGATTPFGWWAPSSPTSGPDAISRRCSVGRSRSVSRRWPIQVPGRTRGSRTRGVAPPAMADWVDVVRHGRVVARIGYDPARTDAEVVGCGCPGRRRRAGQRRPPRGARPPARRRRELASPARRSPAHRAPTNRARPPRRRTTAAPRAGDGAQVRPAQWERRPHAPGPLRRRNCRAVGRPRTSRPGQRPAPGSLGRRRSSGGARRPRPALAGRPAPRRECSASRLRLSSSRPGS